MADALDELEKRAAELEGVEMPPDETAPDAAPAGELSKAQMRDMLSSVMHGGFSMLAPAWKIKVQECDMLAECYTALLDKYFPGGMAMGPELTAAAVTLAIFAPRWGKPRVIEESADNESE